MTRILRLQPLTPEAFAPFGVVKEPPAPGQRDAMEAGLGVNRTDTTVRLAFNHPSPHRLPLLATKMERHPWSSQTFIPLDVSRWVIMVAPDKHGAPDPAGLIAFLATGDQAVNYHIDTWHHPLCVLDRPGRFATLMWTTGVKADDEVWADLPEPFSIEEVKPT